MLLNYWINKFLLGVSRMLFHWLVEPPFFWKFQSLVLSHLPTDTTISGRSCPALSRWEKWVGEGGRGQVGSCQNQVERSRWDVYPGDSDPPPRCSCGKTISYWVLAAVEGSLTPRFVVNGKMLRTTGWKTMEQNCFRVECCFMKATLVNSIFMIYGAWLTIDI